MIFGKSKDDIIEMLKKQIESLNEELKTARTRNDMLVDRLLVKNNIPEVMPHIANTKNDDIIDDRKSSLDTLMASSAIIGQDFGEEDKTVVEEQDMEDKKNIGEKEDDAIEKAYKGWIDAGKEMKAVEDHVPESIKKEKRYYPSFYIEGIKKFGNFPVGEDIELNCICEVESVKKSDPDNDGEMIYEVFFKLKKFKVEDGEIDIGEDEEDKKHRKHEQDETQEEENEEHGDE